MDRRDAIKGMAIFTAGMTFLSSCKSEEAVSLYKNLSINSSNKASLKSLCDSFLPLGDSGIVLPEDNVDFVMLSLNDCFSPENIGKYQKGMEAFNAMVSEKHSKSYADLSSTEMKEVFESISGDDVNEDIKYFGRTTRGLVLRNFTTSEDYLTKFRNYSMIPPLYKACTPVS